MQTLLNVTAQVALVCCLAALLLGAAALGLGRVTGSYQGGGSGVQMILRGAVGALIVASAASFISWLIR
ncbi:MAG TPA: hypothetical protein VEL73_02055 [Mycobacteriales bacterium]|nr:hypothetical protein [Mycobacteriales bacterium]